MCGEMRIALLLQVCLVLLANVGPSRQQTSTLVLTGGQSQEPASQQQQQQVVGQVEQEEEEASLVSGLLEWLEKKKKKKKEKKDKEKKPLVQPVPVPVPVPVVPQPKVIHIHINNQLKGKEHHGGKKGAHYEHYHDGHYHDEEQDKHYHGKHWWPLLGHHFNWDGYLAADGQLAGAGDEHGHESRRVEARRPVGRGRGARPAGATAGE